MVWWCFQRNVFAISATLVALCSMSSTFFVSTQATGCVFTPVNNQSFVEDIQHHLETLLIQYDISFSNVSSQLDWDKARWKRSFEPYRWFRAESGGSYPLLLVRQIYFGLIWPYLSFDVHEVDLTLEVSPYGCVESLDPDALRDKIQAYLLEDFNIYDPDMDNGDVDICYQQVTDKMGTGQLEYACCHYSQDKQLTCQNIGQDGWALCLQVLFVVATMVLFLNIPEFIPKGYKIYTYCFKPKDDLKFKFVLTSNPDAYNAQVFKAKHWKPMYNFRQLVSSPDLETDVPYIASVSRLDFSVSMDRLVQDGQSPVSLGRSFFDAFIRCKIRHMGPFKFCCAQPCCGTKWTICSFWPSWLIWMKAVRTIVVMVVLAVPALPLMYALTADGLTYQDLAKVIEDEDMVPPLYSNTIFNRVIVIIVASMYIINIFIVVIDGATDKNIGQLYSDVLQVTDKKITPTCAQCGKKGHRKADCPDNPEVNEPLLKKGVNKMKDEPQREKKEETSQVQAPNRSSLEKLCKLIGERGVLVIPVLLLVVAIAPIYALGKYIFKSPTLKLTREAVVKIWQRLKRRTSNKEYGDSVEIIAFLVSFLFVVIVLAMGINFLIHLAAMLLIKVISDDDLLKRYVPIVIAVMVLLRDPLTKVSIKFLVFQNTVLRTIKKKEKEQLKMLSLRSVKDRYNVIYKVIPKAKVKKDEDDPGTGQACGQTPAQSGQSASQAAKKATMKLSKLGKRERGYAVLGEPTEIIDIVPGRNLFRLKYDRPRMNTKQLIIFYSKYHILYCSKNFIMDKCVHMSSGGAPGHLSDNYLSSILSYTKKGIVVIAIFLIVMAYGSSHFISPSAQLIITFASTLLPKIVSKLSPKKMPEQDRVLDIDVTKRRFESELRDQILHFEQSWNVEDIVVKEIVLALDEISNESDCTQSQRSSRASSDDIDLVLDVTDMGPTRRHAKVGVVINSMPEEPPPDGGQPPSENGMRWERIVRKSDKRRTASDLNFLIDNARAYDVDSGDYDAPFFHDATVPVDISRSRDNGEDGHERRGLTIQEEYTV